MPEPKILFFDIESAGVNALKSDLGFVIVFGYKWLGAKRAQAISIDRASLRRFDDRKLLVEASKLLAEADIIVGHFASVFDRRFIQGRLLINDLPPIPPTKMRDTCMMARSIANYSSNRLKHLAKILKLDHQKLENGWPDNWMRVMQGDARALRELTAYCKGDVLALEALYLKLRPFDNPHPRLIADRTKCGICGGDVEFRGYAFLNDNKYRRYVCRSCKKWGRERKAVKDA
jgi:uncharacterized protein YprB with RNaseH-like and TPR domain